MIMGRGHMLKGNDASILYRWVLHRVCYPNSGKDAVNSYADASSIYSQATK